MLACSRVSTAPRISVRLLLTFFFVIYLLTSFRCAAEDTRDASKKIPKSLLWSITANMISCLIVAVLIVLCAGDVLKLFTGPLGASGHPLGAIVQLTYNAARESKALASAPFGLVAPILAMCCINNTAAASRMLFSFIRDDRNPFVHKIMAMVSAAFVALSRHLANFA